MWTCLFLIRLFFFVLFFLSRSRNQVNNIYGENNVIKFLKIENKKQKRESKGEESKKDRNPSRK